MSKKTAQKKTKVKRMPHTPGPWIARFNVPTAEIQGHIIYEDAEDGFPIASLWVGGGTHGKPTQISNAHLIAAAPQLLTALKETLPIIDDAHMDAREKAARKPGAPWANVALAFQRQAHFIRSVIAKAEGKAPFATSFIVERGTAQPR